MGSALFACTALFIAGLSALIPAASISQSSLLKQAPQPQHVTVAASPAAAVAAGATLSLWAEVTPRPGVHVYAAGAKDFTAVGIVPTPAEGVTFLKPSFAPSTLVATLGASAPVPAYRTTFRITQPVRIDRSVARATRLTIAAAINYQACDDRLCYPVSSVPVLWSVTVE